MPTIDATTQLIASVDQGTTSSRCIIFTRDGQVAGFHKMTHQRYDTEGQSGWHEHDLIEIRDNVITCINEATRRAGETYGVTLSQIKAVGITNQRETVSVWDRQTGQPLHRAIVWHDVRTHDVCEALRKKISPNKVRQITGLNISTYFSAVKLRWMMDHVPAVRDAIENGTAMVGTIDTWLVYSLTREKNHLTDITNAGRTMLMDIRTGTWDPQMMDLIGIDASVLPEIRSCSELFGHLDGTVLKGTPITGVIGDQQSALVGQSCFSPGQAKNTYGTGCFLIVNCGETPQFSKYGLLTTPAYKLGPKQNTVYSLEGSVASGGLVIEWLRENLGLFTNPEESEALAEAANPGSVVQFVPAFNGLLAPRWDESARAGILGMTLETNKADLVRAAFEGIVCRVNDVLVAAANDMGRPLTDLRVDGGCSVNNLLIQMQSDISNLPVVRPQVIETTALGAAFCAGHADGIGLFDSPEEFCDVWKPDVHLDPKIGEEERKKRLSRFEAAIERCSGWTDGGSLCSIGASKQIIVAMVFSSCVTAAVTATLCRIFAQRK
eukprot:GFKZ01012626.1.p1 GENE.GFKZ01012626.1~~GFKZ01012626.1.p1  ORF type:complete len:551 (+),score=61.71 GFKZ01012626.1:327-1979(+)